MRVEVVTPLVWLSTVSALQHHAVSRSRDVQPNILFFMTDSMDGRLVDPLSTESKGVDMPFLRDFFAANGTSFVKSYAHNPMCVPSRTSMMTGRTSHNISIWGNSGGLAASPSGVLDETCVEGKGEDECERMAKEQGYPEHIFSAFQKLGYNTTMYGRLHIGAAMKNSEPHDDMVEGNPTYTPFDATKGMELGRYGDIRRDPGDGDRGEYLERVSEEDGDISMFSTDWSSTVSGCINFIKDLPSPSDATKPFFLHCSFNVPHEPFSTNSTWLASVHSEKISLPTWLENYPDSYHPYDSFMTMSLGLAEANITEEDMLKLRKVYYAMNAEADAMIQSIWDALVDRGYGLHDTYVVYVSDHGELAFDHRLVYKASMYEGSVRVPIQLAGPGITQGQRVDTHVASLLDIFPTLLDMAGESAYSKYSALAGKSLLKVAGGTSVAPSNMTLGSGQAERYAVVSNYNWVEGNTGAYMVRAGKWKMIVYGHTYNATKDYQPQLFNIDDDPEELKNVYADNQDIAEWLDGKLREVMDPDEVDRTVAEQDWKRLNREFPCMLNLTVESKNTEWSACKSVWNEDVLSLIQILSLGEGYGHPEDKVPLIAWVQESREIFGDNMD